MSIHLPSFMMILVAVAVASVVFSLLARSLDGFFRGTSDTGAILGLQPERDARIGDLEG